MMKLKIEQFWWQNTGEKKSITFTALFDFVIME
jgi:hypothetical protein